MSAERGLAFTYYDEPGWNLMRELAPDGASFPPWAEVVPYLDDMRDRPEVDLITFDTATVLAAHRWCADNGHRLDHEGRVKFIQYAARLMYGADDAGRA